jgi:hypothetical protein
VTLVARARLGLVGPFIGRDHRYLTDAAVFGPLCLALALLPLRPGLDRALYGDPPPAAEDELDDELDDEEAWPAATPDPEVDGVPEADPDEDPDEDGIDHTPVRSRVGRVRAGLIARAQAWQARRAPSLLLYGTLVMAMVTVGGVLSSEQYMKTWETNPAPKYFLNLEYGLADPSRPHPLFMFDQEIPPLIMTPTFESERMLSHVMKVFGDDAPVFGWWSPRFLAADGEGKLHPGAVAGPAASPATGLACSDERAPAQGVSVTLPQAPPEWEWKIQITYSADQDTAARVRYGQGEPVPVRLRKGLNNVYVRANGAGPAVTVSDLAEGAVVCIGRVVVGNAVPDPNAVEQSQSS